MTHPLQHRAALPSILVAAVVGAIGSFSAHAQQAAAGRGVLIAPKKAMRDVVDEKTLQMQVASTAKLDVVLSAKSKPVEGPRPNLESTLLSGSVILSDGEKFTLVPVGSILHLPETHRTRILTKPEGEFTFWPAFLQRNASWLCAKEVPLKMAKGDSKTAQGILRETSGEGRVVVAVYRGGPITILEPVPARANPPKSR